MYLLAVATKTSKARLMAGRYSLHSGFVVPCYAGGCFGSLCGRTRICAAAILAWGTAAYLSGLLGAGAWRRADVAMAVWANTCLTFAVSKKTLFRRWTPRE